MGQKVVTMEQRLAAVFAYVAAGRATVVRCVSIYAASLAVWAWALARV